jgi:hypothetical protein
MLIFLDSSKPLKKIDSSEIIYLIFAVRGMTERCEAKS